MKNFLLVITILIITSLRLLAQWSTDPNNNLIIATGWDPHIVSDSAGGCYVTYNYESFYPQKLAVERLDLYGYKPWGNKKQILGELPEQWQAEIIEDGQGGVIISYQDNQVIGTFYTTRVRVQKVDSGGNFLWGQTGVRVNLSESNHGAQELVSDGEGGCVIVWQNIDASYWMNRINRFGQREWGDTGIAIGNGNSKWIIRASDGNYYVQIGLTVHRIGREGQILNQYTVSLGYPVPDLEGGIVLSGRVWNGMIPKLVAQRKDSLGSNLWQEPYIEISDTLDLGTSLNILANDNYYNYGWLGRKNGIAEILQIQILRDDGTKLFIGGPIHLDDLPTSITSIPIIPSYNGSNIYAWTHWDSPQTYNANYARRIDTTGSDLWQNNSVLLNEPSLGYFSMTTDCFGGAIGVGYLNADFAIRVLKVSVNGILGEIITSISQEYQEIFPTETILFQNFPNPFNSTTYLKYQTHREERIKIVLYNILGEELKTLTDEYKSGGTFSITFNSNELPSGVYFYALETGSEVVVKKLTILK